MSSLKLIDHQFANPQLDNEATPNYQPYIRLSFFFHKSPEVSYEQFHHHWQTVHADLTVATKDFQGCHVLRYNQDCYQVVSSYFRSTVDLWFQFHSKPELQQKLKDVGAPMLDYDGCSDIYVEKWEDWVAFSSSKEFNEVLSPDGPIFMTLPFKIMIGQDNLIFGKALSDIGGKDGLLAKNIRHR